MQAEKGRQPPYFCVCPFRSHTVTNYTAPTGALNKSNTREVLGLLTDLNREGQSILMVTHDLQAAVRGKLHDWDERIPDCRGDL